MEKDKQKRPTDRGKTTAARERPKSPASRPKSARPRTGNAASREAARKERLAGQEQPVRRVRTAPEEEPAQQEKPSKRERTASREKAVKKERSARKERSRKRERTAGQELASAKEPAAKREQPARQEPAPKKERTPVLEEPGQPVPKGKKKKPHRVYNTNFGFKFAIMLSVVAVIVLSMIIFFKVKHIEVILPKDENGQTRSYYTAEEIVSVSGINLDDNLLSLSKATVAARIYAERPYVNEVQIKKQLPGTVVISFTEFEVTYGIQDEQGGWWLMSREGRILEPADEETVRGHLTVTGMTIQVPQVGDWFKPAATEGADMSEIANKQTVVLQVIPALEETSFVKKLDRVDVSTSYDLTLWWADGRLEYEIKLGTTERLDYKLQYFQTILEDGSIANKSGTVDLTFAEDNKAHFLPFP